MPHRAIPCCPGAACFPATFPVPRLLLEEKVPSLLPFALLLPFLGLTTENRSLCSPFSQVLAGTPALIPSYSSSHKKRSGASTSVIPKWTMAQWPGSCSSLAVSRCQEPKIQCFQHHFSPARSWIAFLCPWTQTNKLPTPEPAPCRGSWSCLGRGFVCLPGVQSTRTVDEVWVWSIPSHVAPHTRGTAAMATLLHVRVSWRREGFPRAGRGKAKPGCDCW